MDDRRVYFEDDGGAYTAGVGGLAPGQDLTIFLEDVQVADVEADYAALFARSGVAQTATARFATRLLPGVTAVTATPLASGTNNQTQTLAATLVGDLAAGEILAVELSGVERRRGRWDRHGRRPRRTSR